MAKNKKLWIDMCAGSELKDTQGETLSVDGADIADLKLGKGRFNDNHGKGFFNSLGRVTEAKKIMKAEDCDNERHEYYWNKIKAPYIYAKGYLYNDEDHPNAKAAAAIMRNIHREDAPLAMKASVEGGVVARGIKDQTRLARTKIHSVALTFTPANNATLVEPLNINKSDTDWEADKQLIKSVMHLAETNIPSFRHIERHASANTIHENIQKIQDMAKSLGIDIEVKESCPNSIMKNAVTHKIHNNIQKISGLIKAAKKLTPYTFGMDAGDTATSLTPPKPKEPSTETFSDKRAAIREAKENEYQQGIKQLRDKRVGSTEPTLQTQLSIQDNPQITTPKQAQMNAAISRHTRKAATDPNHLNNIFKQISQSHGEDKAKAVIAKLRSGMRKSVKGTMIKALTAGYGGAGAPTNLTSGGVFQPEALEDGRPKSVTVKAETSDGISYISCDNCGKEQAYMKHQVKCRHCGSNFSLAKLEDFMKSLVKKKNELKKARATDWEEDPSSLEWPSSNYGEKTNKLKPLTPRQKQIIASITEDNKVRQGTVERLATDKFKQDPKTQGHSYIDKEGDDMTTTEIIPEASIKQWNDIPEDLHDDFINENVDRDFRRDHKTGKIYHRILSGDHAGTYLPMSDKPMIGGMHTQQELKDIVKKPNKGF